MKKLWIVLFLLLMPALMFAQAPPTPDTGVSNLYAGGISYNPGATPAIAGTGLWAHKIADNDGKETYSFTAVDALPSSLKPFTVTTNVSTGIAQKVVTIGKLPIYLSAGGGFTWSGQNAGWNYNTAVMTSIKLKDNWRLCPTLRAVRNNVDGTGEIRPVFGVLFGWGQ